MIKRVFNRTLPRIRQLAPCRAPLILESPTEKDLEGIVSFKYADLSYAYHNSKNEYVRYVLDKIPIKGNYKQVLVDIKVHDLKEGECPCVPGWHLDGSANARNLPKQPEIFTLFVTGEHARTEFLGEPFSGWVRPDEGFAEMSRHIGATIPDSVSTWTIPACTFATYDDTFFHRGSRATGNERRLLIRITETDVIEPQNRPYKPHYG